MSFPYPAPPAIPTTLRCQFSMPGRKYDCRAIGKYMLNGRRYCAPHYDTTWKFQNPLYGQVHDWHFHVNHLTGAVDKYPTCRVCMAIKVYDGLPQSLCRGVMPRVELR